jgi:hypothetical protein
LCNNVHALGLSRVWTAFPQAFQQIC